MLASSAGWKLGAATPHGELELMTADHHRRAAPRRINAYQPAAPVASGIFSTVQNEAIWNVTLKDCLVGAHVSRRFLQN